MITKNEYWDEVRSLARGVCEDTFDGCDTKADYEDTLSEMLFEAIDGHQWVIYYAYNLPVLQLSDNAEYMIDNFGEDSVTDSLKRGGLSGLHTALAFWAMYADVQEEIHDVADTIARRYDEPDTCMEAS